MFLDLSVYPFDAPILPAPKGPRPVRPVYGPPGGAARIPGLNRDALKRPLGYIRGDLGKAIGLVGVGFAAADLLDGFFKDRFPYKPPAYGGWYRVCGPALYPVHLYNAGKAQGAKFGNSCISGQAIAGTTYWPPTVLETHSGLLHCSRDNPPELGGGFANHDIWNRNASGPTGQPRTLPVLFVPAMPTPFAPHNPNFTRGRPALAPAPLAQPVPRPIPVPRTVVGDAGFPFPPRHNRAPPGPKEKEAPKVSSRGKAISLALVAALDTVSELAEVVDAMYDALPKQVRRRWEKEKLGAHWVKDFKTGKLKWWVPPSIPSGYGARVINVDEFGQYGIQGAHWKVQALWHNWRQLDSVAAVENIARNVTEDQIHGFLHQHLPRNTGYALNDGFAQFGKDLNSMLDAISVRNIF